MTENAMHAERQHSTEPAEGAEPDEVGVPENEPRAHTDEHAEGDDDD
jgi:hypothetical protein